MNNNLNRGISSNKTIKMTKDEIKELIKQYKIMRKLLETWPRRKVMMSYEKEWNLKREAFFKKHPKITKLYKTNSQ